MQERNRALMNERSELLSRSEGLKKEKDGLKEQIEKLNGSIVYLQNLAEKLEKEGDGFREQVDQLNAKLVELTRENDRLALLTRPENLVRTLGERLGELQKQVNALSGENKKLKSRQVMVRREEDKAAGAEAVKIQSDIKPEAVQVSAGQTTEVVEPAQ